MKISPQDLDKIENDYLDKRDRELSRSYVVSPYTLAGTKSVLGAEFKMTQEQRRRFRTAEEDFKNAH